jgi:hypothetical protein
MFRAILKNSELGVHLKNSIQNASFYTSLKFNLPGGGGGDSSVGKHAPTTKNLVPSSIVRSQNHQRNGGGSKQHRNKDYSKKKGPNASANLFRITNVGNNTSRIFRGVPEDRNDAKNFAFKGKTRDLADELDDEDPEKLLQYEEELDMYARDEGKFHSKVIDEDIARRRRMKMAIIKKKVGKIEGEKYRNTNLLTWDAKEQIKYLNLTYPSRSVLDYFGQARLKKYGN